MKKLTILLLTAVMVMTFSMGAMAFYQEGNEYSVDVGTSRVQIDPTGLNQTIEDKNTNTYEPAKTQGYTVEPIGKMEEMSSYYVRILSRPHKPGNGEDSIMPSMSKALDVSKMKAGWQYEKINAEVTGTIKGYDNNESNYKNIKDSYNLSVHGPAIVIDYSSNNIVGFTFTTAAGYYFGNMTHTIKTENNTETKKESFSGLGGTIEAGLVANVGKVKLYGKAGYRKIHISNYDLNGTQYTAGLTFEF